MHKTRGFFIDCINLAKNEPFPIRRFNNVLVKIDKEIFQFNFALALQFYRTRHLLQFKEKYYKTWVQMLIIINKYTQFMYNTKIYRTKFKILFAKVDNNYIKLTFSFKDIWYIRDSLKDKYKSYIVQFVLSK